MPTISVIVPVYNVQEYLERCLKSIQFQTFSDFECIMIDDGSTDDCPKICDEWSKKDTRFIAIHKQNGGQSSARNVGLKMAKGEILSFVDSDDWISPFMFEDLLKILEKTHCDIVTSGYILAYEENAKLKRKYSYKILNKNNALKRFLRLANSNRINDYPLWNKLYRNNVFENITFPENIIYEDLTVSTECILNAKTVAVTKSQYYCYFQKSQSTTRSPLTKRNLDIFSQAKKIENLVAPLGKKYRRLSKNISTKAYFSLLAKICNGDYDKSIYDENFIKKSIQVLKKNYFQMMISTMSIKRKLAYTAMCCNFKLLQKITGGGGII